MGLKDDVLRWVAKTQAREQALFTSVVQAAHESITVGYQATGAPGQPVDTGRLRASWQTAYEADRSAMISTNVEYAQQIEAGTREGRKMTVRSQVGGFHSVKMTVAGFSRLVAYVLSRLGPA